VDEIICEVRALAAQNVKEVVLTGVHLGAYGRDLEARASLDQLIAAIMGKTTIPRLSLSSLEPWDLTEALFDLWRDPRLCPHLHLPLQSGCGATLRRMARRITPDTFARLTETANKHIPDLAITTDLIVGFPGETDAEFEESYRFVEAIGFSRLHVFRYSSRPGTPAARMPNHVPEDCKRERSGYFLALDRKLRRNYVQQYIGRKMDVLWESAREVSPPRIVWMGLTGNYIRATIVAPPDGTSLYNTITSTRFIGVRGNQLIGETDGIPALSRCSF
jgi:threonylcarbamoyladenosine tRNA methylthiotransferase MtaB